MSKPTKKTLLVIIISVTIVALGGSYFLLNRRSNSEPDPSNLTSDAKSTSELPSAQNDFNVADIDIHDNAKDRQPGNSIREDEGSAGIHDTHGSIPKSISTSNPIISSSGQIGVYAPKPNQRITNKKVTVAGKSTLQSVYYRISDDISGVVTSGSLNVVSGEFSGNLTISTNAKHGQISFFGTQKDGNEFSNVTIPLVFR